MRGIRPFSIAGVVAGGALCAACTSSRSSAGNVIPSTGGVAVGSGGSVGSGLVNASSGGTPAAGGAPATFAGAGGVSIADSGGAAGRSSSSGGAALRDASIGGAGPRDGGDSLDAGDGSSVGAEVPPPEPGGCLSAADVTPGVHQVTCDSTIDVVTVPEVCTRRACGVIVDVHGGMMSSQMEDKNTNLSALGLKHGYLVIQPNAMQNLILLNQRLFVADAPGMPADDTRVMDILGQVMKTFHADTKRIHMTGFSEGGFMTWRWFCQHSDLLASVAPGAAAWRCANLANLGLTPPEIGCEFSGAEAGADVPEHDIPALYVQGMKDGLVDPMCADGWVRSNVFTALKLDKGVQISGDATYTRTRYLNPDGVPFEYIQHQYQTTSSFLGVALAGHCYPGSMDLTVTPSSGTTVPPDQLISFGCNDATSFNWGEEVMKFFIAHPKR